MQKGGNEYTEQKERVLIVDDSPMILALLENFLSGHYQLIKAENGEEAFAIALEQKPDLIITDLMMPEMDGYALLKAVRSTTGIDHIPMIMLTAVDTDLNKLEGYKMGLDFYLTKPFGSDELMIHIRNLLDNRKKTKNHMERSIRLGGENLDGANMDEEFMHRMDRIIEQYLADPELKVNHLADGLSISLSTLERRLKQLFNTTPKLYIRDYRLTRAMQLLKQRRGNVNEVASMCGFDNNSYFSVCFREKYGMTPSEMLGNSYRYKKLGDEQRPS